MINKKFRIDKLTKNILLIKGFSANRSWNKPPRCTSYRSWQTSTPLPCDPPVTSPLVKRRTSAARARRGMTRSASVCQQRRGRGYRQLQADLCRPPITVCTAVHQPGGRVPAGRAAAGRAITPCRRGRWAAPYRDGNCAVPPAGCVTQTEYLQHCTEQYTQQ